MNIGVSYHVVESVSFSGKRITMVRDGGHDLIYRSVLSRHFTRAEVVMLCQLADNFHLKLSPIFCGHA